MSIGEAPWRKNSDLSVRATSALASSRGAARSITNEARRHGGSSQKGGVGKRGKLAEDAAAGGFWAPGLLHGVASALR